MEFGRLYDLMSGSQIKANDFYGKEIAKAEISERALQLTFSDSIYIEIFDGNQSCCEHRYMTTDDDVRDLIGHKLVRIEAKAGPGVGDCKGQHETCFVEVATDVGFITIVNHNEHNGDYSGFCLALVSIGASHLPER